RAQGAPPRPAAPLPPTPAPRAAPHDPAMVRLTRTLVARHQRDRETFEFQMLYGVRRDLHEQVVADGYRLRGALPCGTQWSPYFMRRLAERPANLYFCLSNLVK